MAKNQDLWTLAQVGLSGDSDRLKRVIEAIISNERAKNRGDFANKLEGLLRQAERTNPALKRLKPVGDEKTSLISEGYAQKCMRDLILDDKIKATCDEIISEQQNSELLSKNNLSPRNKILLTGPAGNGKTSLAGAIAKELDVPLYVANYETVFAQFLGQSAVNMGRLFDHARNHACVLFFDEFDAIGVDRSIEQDIGEAKRVVNSMIMRLDSLPSHVLFIGASNHRHVIDPALWRRFQIRINLSRPGHLQTENWIQNFVEKTDIDILWDPVDLSSAIHESIGKVNFSDVEEFCDTILRRYILGKSKDMSKIIEEILAQWKEVRPQHRGEVDET